MSSLFATAISYLSRICGLESVTSFPAEHMYSRTRWDPAYFDIPYGMKPDQIERTLCNAIANTPEIFAHIKSPTPQMQRTFLAALHESMRHNGGTAEELVRLLIAAYASPHTQEVVPGLRTAIVQSAYDISANQAHLVLAFLANMKAPFGVIDER